MKDGMMDGEWKNRDFSGYDGLWIANYKEDKYNGLVQHFWYDENHSLRMSTEGIMKADSFVTYFKKYYWNGNLHLETKSDTPTTFTYNMGFDSQYYSFMPDSVYKNYQKYLKFKKKKDKIKYAYYADEYYRYSWERPYTLGGFPNRVPYTLYHSNGELFGKFRYEVFDLKKKGWDDYYAELQGGRRYELVYDTLFNPIGRPAVIRKNLSDSLGQRRYCISAYDAEGLLYKRDYFVLDSNNTFFNYQSEYAYAGGPLTINQLDYKHFYNSDSLLFSNDTLILQAAGYGYEGKFKRYVASHIPDKVFTESRSYHPNVNRSFKVLKNDTIYNYYYHLDYGDVDVFSYYSEDTTANAAAQRLGDIESTNFLFGDDFNADSIVVLYKQKPYTGIINVKNYNNKEMPKAKLFVTEEGDSMMIRDSYTFKKNELNLYKSYYDYDETSFIKLELEKGNVLSIKLYDNKGRIIREASFKNNMLEGVDRSYVYQKKFLGYKKLPKKESHFVNGLKEGKELSWRCSDCEFVYDYNHYDGEGGSFAFPNEMPTKKEPKYYLYEKTTYWKGSVIDSALSYYPSGKLNSFYVKDSAGNNVGEDIVYFRDGKINTRANYANGVMDGVFYRLNEKGDTVDMANWVEGKLEGLTLHYRYDEETGALIKKAIQPYRGDLPYSKWITYGEFGVKRVEIDIDTAFNQNSYFEDLSSVNDWMGSDIEGTIRVYHPNGVLYCEGKTKVDRRKRDYGIDSVYSMRKVGLWIYRNTVGRVITEVNYYKQFARMDNGDSIFYLGDYKEFYGDGKLKYEGKLLFEGDRLDCASDIAERAFYVEYKTYIDEKGEALVKNGSGKVTVFYGDGKIWMEGSLVNGKEDGWWKAYNKEGVLIEVGQYKDGQKDGRWLSGDLTGVNYIDGKCFQSEEEKKKEQEESKNIIQLEQRIWKNGKLVSSDYFYFVRSN